MTNTRVEITPSYSNERGNQFHVRKITGKIIATCTNKEEAEFIE